MEVSGQPSLDDSTMVGWRYVSPDYFSLLNVPILRGRAFTEQDRDSDGRVLILNESLARRLFPNQDALGKVIDGRSVIGITADVKNSELAAPIHPEYYIVRPGAGNPGSRDINRGVRPGGHFIIESSLDSELLTSQVRMQIASVDPIQPVVIETLQHRVSRLLDRPRFNALLVVMFAAVGLALSAIGLYGANAFLVAERTREIGLRIALGATRQNVTGLVLSNAARWNIAGALAGIAGSIYLSQQLQSLLFEVSPDDPVHLITAAGVLVCISLIAAGIPSRRAARIDAAVSLRHN
jgi:hypothetical protein